MNPMNESTIGDKMRSKKMKTQRGKGKVSLLTANTDKIQLWESRVESLSKELLKADPTEAVYGARSMLDAAATVLLKLIESGKLRNDGAYRDEAESHLCAHIESLGTQLSELVVTKGHLDSVATAWWLATELAKAIHDLALGCAARKTAEQERQNYSLQKVAGDKLFMPSLRAKAKSFTYDFDEVVKTIGLSRACAINTERGARYSFESYATMFVAEFIEHVTHWKQKLNAQKAAFDFYKRRNPQSKRTFEDRLAQEYPKMPVAKLLIYADLPPFEKDTIGEWWDKAIKPYLEDGETLVALHGTRFLKALEDSTNVRKDYEIRAELKRRCEQALRAATFVKPSTHPPQKIKGIL